MADGALGTVPEQVHNSSGARSFPELPDEPGYWYAVWLDASGAAELSSVAPEPVPAGVVYVGECVTQSVRRHLMHRDLGSLTLMKNLAAILREPWSLRAERRGAHLVEPGRRKLLDWMDDHLTATCVQMSDEVSTRALLSMLDPPLRLIGWRPEQTVLRQHISAQRAVLDSQR